MISSVMSSLSPEPIPQTKNNDAYRRYTTLVSVEIGYHYLPSSFLYTKRLALVLQEITHSRAASQDELSDVLHNLGLCLGRHGREPFCKANFT